jgi:lysozyme
MTMHMSVEGINALLKKFEGCKLKAYKCPAGVWTIGYGHTSAAGAPEVVQGMTITQVEANDILRRDLVKYEKGVEALVKQPLTQNQFDVLVDFAYNAGAGALKSSTLLKKINAGEFDAVPAELMKWTKGGGKVLPGLVNRRRAEAGWWRSLDAEPIDEQEQRAEPDAIVPKTMVESKQGNAALLTAGVGGLGVAKEVAAQAQDASDTADKLMGLLSNSNFLIMVVVIALAGAIWFWRKKHMEEHGV